MPSRTSRSGRSRAAVGLGAAVLMLTFAGCRGMPSSRPPIHIVPNMDYQEKSQAQEASDFFYDGLTMRHPVPGTVAIGELRQNDAYYSGKNDDGSYLASSPLPGSEEVLTRGADRYTIYCQPCHDRRGTGRGILHEYGTPTASFHDEQRRGYPDGQIFDVITNGVGLMKGYRYPLSADDRWAIVVYVRQLQEERAARQAAGG